MGIVSRWRHGGVEYPLDSSTSDDFLKVADPAVYYTLQIFEQAINAYVGDALLARARVEGLNFPSAVEQTLHYEPTPHLLTDQLVFPLLCVYRSDETWAEKTVSFNEDASTWEWAYVLPPLTPRQIDKLHPIFRAVSVVVQSFAMQSYDPNYAAGQTIRDLAGIERMVGTRTRYGQFEPIDGNAKWWKAVTGQMLVKERSKIVEDAFPKLEGANFHLDLADGDDPVVADFAVIEGPPDITITNVSPSAGTLQGNQLVYIDGEGFQPGKQAPHVLFGGAYASSVVAIHPNRLQCLTPAHDAQPTCAVDVQVIDVNGKESNVLAGAYTFTTP